MRSTRTTPPPAKGLRAYYRLKGGNGKLTDRQIAERLGVSVRAIYRWKRKYILTPDGGVAPAHHDPAAPHELSEEAKACLEPTTWGFVRFYNRYSGRSLPKHARRMVAIVLNHDQVVINLPPGHLKTSTVSEWVSIWLLTMNRNLQVLIISKTDRFASTICQHIAWEFEHNEALKADFGDFAPTERGLSWSPKTGQLSLNGRDPHLSGHGPSLLTCGAGQQVYGFRADVVICDDMVDLENSKTEQQRKDINEWFHTIVFSRVRPDGRKWVIGTRFGRDDLYGELTSKQVEDPKTGKMRPMWAHVNLPALRDPETDEPTMDWERGVALWDDPDVVESWPKDKLLAIYYNVGERVFTQTYQQIPLASGLALVHPDWIYGNEPGCLDKDRSKGDMDQGEGFLRVASLDPAPRGPAGFIVADLRADPFEVRILEMRREPMSVRKMLNLLEYVYDHYATCRQLVFEHNIAQRFFNEHPATEEWLNSHGFRLLAHSTSRNKVSDEYGVSSLAVDFEMGRIRLPWADQASREMSRVLIEEATTYTGDKDGRPYDLLMALWFIAFNRRILAPPPSQGLRIKGFRQAVKSPFRGFVRRAS